MEVVISAGLKKAMDILGDDLNIEINDIVEMVKKQKINALSTFEVDCMTDTIVTMRDRNRIELKLLSEFTNI